VDGGCGAILMVVTSHSRLGETGRRTGFYLSEVAHPFRVLTNHGHEVEFASPAGGHPPMDPASSDPEDKINAAFLADADATARLSDSLRPDQVDPLRYAAIFFAGGHGCMWDLPGNRMLARITTTIYENNGVVAAVCHGPAGLVDVRLSDGRYLLERKTAVSFTNEEEAAVELDHVVPFLLEDRIRERGANFIGAAPFAPQVVTCERIVTGQNPASAEGLALTLAKLLEELASV
jgi:putative intracellular protease/amidase